MRHGKFMTHLDVRLVNDTASEGQGSWQLLAALMYQAANDDIFVVPAGFLTDFASVPRLPIGYALVGNRAHKAAVLHDWLVREEIVPRKEADDLFAEAMEATHIPEAYASLMHLAVRSYTASLEPPGPEGQGHELI